MTSIRNLASLLALIPAPTAAPRPDATTPAVYQCGEANIFLTGLPAWDPQVTEQGFNPDFVNTGIQNETVNLIHAGYNIQILLAGGEVPMETIEDRLLQTGVDFHGLGIGFGVRGSTIPSLVARFEDLLHLYFSKFPKAQLVFNSSPADLLTGLHRRFPLAEDCTALSKPGRLLGYEDFYPPPKTIGREEL